MNWIKFFRDDPNITTGLLSCENQNLNCDLSGINVNVVGDPLAVSINAVHKIANEYPGPYYLLASGGIDSQAMIYAWLQSGIDFKVVHFVYNNNMNSHDIDPLKIFCKLNGISITYMDIDHFSFLKNELQHYAKKYICASPHINFYMKFIEYINDGTCIFSGHPLSCSTGVGHNFSQLGLYRYMTISGRNLIPNFFLHTPELGKVWFAHTKKILNEIDEILVGYGVRCYMYAKAKFPIIPSKKITGFENYKILCDKYPELVSTKQRIRYNKNKHVYDILYRWPLYDIHRINEVITYTPSLENLQNYIVDLE